jgi:hypothetical protein
VIAARFPAICGGTGDGAKDLYGVCMFNLNKEFKKTSKPDFQAIWGSLACLDSLLGAFPSLASEAADVDALFR